MQAVNKLFANSTNRQPILLLPTYCPTQQQPHLHQIKRPIPIHPPRQLIFLAQREELLERQLKQASAEHQMMLQLFENMLKVQRGQTKQTKKMQRRCNKDILDKMPCTYAGCSRFYSSEATLQRHVKLKHKIVKHEPPQLYHDLHPQPNLTTQVQSQESEVLSNNSDELIVQKQQV